jgi:ATP-dependent DNA helicase RecQ
VFRQLVASGLLEVDAEGYGGLRLSDASRAVLRGGQPVMLRKELPRKRQRERTARAGAAAPAELAPADLPLFEALRALRTRLAREQNVPPYVIFHDATLRGIAQRRPASLDELAEIGGIGGGKLARYGEDVLETLRGAAAA